MVMQRRIDSIFGPKAKTPVRLPRDEDHSWDLPRRAPVPVDSLGQDEWALVTLFLPPEAIACLAMAFRGGRAAARAAMCGCDLSQLPRYLSKGELCAAFRLTANEVGPWPVDYVFVSRTDLPFVLNLVGGWDALKKRVDKVEEVRLRRIDLNERRAAASKKRRSRLDAWMAAERPFGRGVDSVTRWEISVLHRRHDAERRRWWKDDKILSVFLGNSTLRAPTLQEAKAALVALENEEICKAALEAEIKAEREEREARTKARMEEVVAVLEARGYKLCETCSVVRRYSRRRWKLVSVEDEGKTLGESNATQIAEKIIKEADRRSQEQERKCNLNLALHKRGLTWNADSVTFDAFVEQGRTAAGLQSVEDVAESMSANWRAGVTVDRRCTSFRCNNMHRKVDPAVRSTGPVCGSCERRTDHE